MQLMWSKDSSDHCVSYVSCVTSVVLHALHWVVTPLYSMHKELTLVSHVIWFYCDYGHFSVHCLRLTSILTLGILKVFFKNSLLYTALSQPSFFMMLFVVTNLLLCSIYPTRVTFRLMQLANSICLSLWTCNL